MQKYNLPSCIPTEDFGDDGESDNADEGDQRSLLPQSSQLTAGRYFVAGDFDQDTSVPLKEPILKSLVLSKLPLSSKRSKQTDKSEKRVIGTLHTFRQIFTQSWLNLLLIFVPFGIASNAAGLQPIVVFGLNALAIVPLTGLLTFATENAAQSLGVGAGALLNITFGNMVEFIILFMLREGHLRLVLSSLLGSIFVNLLFILGLATVAGGLKHKEQKYNKRMTQMLIYFMNMGVLSVLIPTSLHASIKHLKQADSVTLKFSRGICVALFILYALYMLFLLRYRPDLAEEMVKSSMDKEAAPLTSLTELQPIESRISAEELSLEYRHTLPGLDEVPPGLPEMDHELQTSMHASVILLICSACVVSICAEYMVNSIEHVVSNAHLTEAFLGLIILPLVGNTSELFTAVRVAMKNKLDLAINVTVGSAIQITLFMVPAMVTLGWMTGKDVTLLFDMFQTVALLVAMMMVNFMFLSGRSSYLLGAVLFVCYAIIGIGAFVLPNQKKNTLQSH